MEKHQIILYRDFDQTKKWSEEPYEVEFKGDKARVVSNEGWTKGATSRFNKLSWHGQTCSGVHYGLRVNGLKAYFISPYKISEK